jgi:hypothetical protein
MLLPAAAVCLPAPSGPIAKREKEQLHMIDTTTRTTVAI